MIHYLANRITAFLHNTGVIQNDIPVYQYGFELIISSTIGGLLVMMVAVIAQDMIGGFVFLSSFYLLRSYTGGLHFDTYTRCNISIISVFVGYLLIAKVVTGDLSIIIMQIISVVGVLIIMKKAPVEHKNKLLSEFEKMKFGRIATAIALLYYVGAWYMQWKDLRYFIVLHYVIAITALLLLIVQRKEKKYEANA